MSISSGAPNVERTSFPKINPKIVNEEDTKVLVDEKNLHNFLGIKKYKFGELESKDKVGVVTGLAWTDFGGEIFWRENFGGGNLWRVKLWRR